MAKYRILETTNYMHQGENFGTRYFVEKATAAGFLGVEVWRPVERPRRDGECPGWPTKDQAYKVVRDLMAKSVTTVIGEYSE